MSEQFKFPDKGLVFWPVGTGDSTTIVIDKNELVMQLDLHHLEKADEDDEPAWPIIDKLIKLLPRKNEKPYLAVFALTHPDQDHVRGFKELLSEITIGEIWHTPRIFRDYEENDELCDDAKAFRKEVHRRRKKMIENPENIGSGHRVRLIGHDYLLEEDDYKDFPKSCWTSPGSSITEIDGNDVSDSFEAFVHAPFKKDAAKERNNTSLALHISLLDGDKMGKVFFFGDREYPTIKEIYEKTREKKREKYLEWDVLLSPHHCSKSVMYWSEEEDKKPKFKKDIMDDFENSKREGGTIIASCRSEFTNEDGSNPPHMKARNRYKEIVEKGNFLCTHEYPNVDNPKPPVFIVGDKGFRLIGTKITKETEKDVASVVIAARGSSTPPKEQVGFGIFK